MRRLRLVSRAFISISSIFGATLKELKKKIYIYYSIFLQKEAITQTYKTYKARQSPSYLLRKTAWEGLVSYSNKRTRKKKTLSFRRRRLSIILSSIRRSDTSSRLAGSGERRGKGRKKGLSILFEVFLRVTPAAARRQTSVDQLCRQTSPRLVGAFSFSRRRPTPPSIPPPPLLSHRFAPDTGETAGTHDPLSTFVPSSKTPRPLAERKED